MAFNKNIYANLFNLGFKEAVISDKIATGKFSGVVKGDVLEIETLGKATGVDYVEGTDITYDKLTNTTTAVPLDQKKVFPYKIEALDEWISTPNLQKATAERIGEGLAELVDTYNFGVIATGAGSTLDVSTISITADNILEVIFEPLVQLFGEASVPESQRKMVVDSKIAAILRRADLANRTEGISGRGYVGNVMGVEIYTSNLLTKDGAKVNMIALSPDAYAFGTGLQDVAIFDKLPNFIGSAIRQFSNYGGKIVAGSENAVIKVVYDPTV